MGSFWSVEEVYEEPIVSFEENCFSDSDLDEDCMETHKQIFYQCYECITCGRNTSADKI